MTTDQKKDMIIEAIVKIELNTTFLKNTPDYSFLATIGDIKRRMRTAAYPASVTSYYTQLDAQVANAGTVTAAQIKTDVLGILTTFFGTL